MGQKRRRWSAEDKLRIVLADACNAGGFKGMEGLKGRGLDGMASDPQAPGTIVIASSQPDEKSMESDEKKLSLFTAALLDAFAGRADPTIGDQDGRLTIGELGAYLNKEVPARAAKAQGKQTPMISMPKGWGGIYLTR